MNFYTLLKFYMGSPWARRVIFPPSKNTPSQVEFSKRPSINLEKCPYTSQQIGPFISGPMSSEIPQAGNQQPPGHNWATFLH